MKKYGRGKTGTIKRTGEIDLFHVYVDTAHKRVVLAIYFCVQIINVIAQIYLFVHFAYCLLKNDSLLCYLRRHIYIN